MRSIQLILMSRGIRAGTTSRTIYQQSRYAFPACQFRCLHFSPNKKAAENPDSDLVLKQASKALDSQYPSDKAQVDSLKYNKYFRGHNERFPALMLRDACTCPICVDPSSTQKNFQSTDIPLDISIASLTEVPDGFEIKWKNDIPGFGEDHVTCFGESFLTAGNDNKLAVSDFRSQDRWDKRKIQKDLRYFGYEDYMTSNETLYHAISELEVRGLLLIRGVPESEKSVEDIAGRIGTIRDSFYGRTWDVKSIPEARNVAYTSQNLGLHMDLLYMREPPGFQLLHCLQNTADGGDSIFSDASHSAAALSNEEKQILSTTKVAYQYKNAGEHYYDTHSVLEFSPDFINYSPPFQAPFAVRRTQKHQSLPRFMEAFRKFANLVEHPDHVLEYRLQPGECVMFNNRRVLHGRKEFDAVGGERWLKGAYVDTSVVSSRSRVLHAEFGKYSKRISVGKRVFPKAQVEMAEGSVTEAAAAGKAEEENIPQEETVGVK